MVSEFFDPKTFLTFHGIEDRFNPWYVQNVLKLCLKVILWENYYHYDSALKLCNLEKLSKRREDRCLRFGLKTLLHPVYKDMFPVNPQVLSPTYKTRNSEHFKVNKANSESYRKSAIPYIQRLLNHYERSKQKTWIFLNISS